MYVFRSIWFGVAWYAQTYLYTIRPTSRAHGSRWLQTNTISRFYFILYSFRIQQTTDQPTDRHTNAWNNKKKKIRRKFKIPKKHRIHTTAALTGVSKDCSKFSCLILYRRRKSEETCRLVFSINISKSPYRIFTAHKKFATDFSAIIMALPLAIFFNKCLPFVNRRTDSWIKDILFSDFWTEPSMYDVLFLSSSTNIFTIVQLDGRLPSIHYILVDGVAVAGAAANHSITRWIFQINSTVNTTMNSTLLTGLMGIPICWRKKTTTQKPCTVLTPSFNKCAYTFMNNL